MPYSVTKFKKEAVKMVSVKINTGGSAFRNEDANIMDINGNKVGRFEIGE